MLNFERNLIKIPRSINNIKEYCSGINLFICMKALSSWPQCILIFVSLSLLYFIVPCPIVLVILCLLFHSAIISSLDFFVFILQSLSLSSQPSCMFTWWCPFFLWSWAFILPGIDADVVGQFPVSWWIFECFSKVVGFLLTFPVVFYCSLSCSLSNLMSSLVFSNHFLFGLLHRTLPPLWTFLPCLRGGVSSLVMGVIMPRIGANVVGQFLASWWIFKGFFQGSRVPAQTLEPPTHVWIIVYRSSAFTSKVLFVKFKQHKFTFWPKPKSHRTPLPSSLQAQSFFYLFAPNLQNFQDVTQNRVCLHYSCPRSPQLKLSHLNESPHRGKSNLRHNLPTRTQWALPKGAPPRTLLPTPNPGRSSPRIRSSARPGRSSRVAEPCSRREEERPGHPCNL